jgi:crotonobetainyl-CoA:carnitine CoA-transferase CaiB-like acyl-CoA transferase
VGALDGITVIEAGLLIQGPQAAATLAEWGAAVTKVELPRFGDQARSLPLGPGERRSAYFEANNRGKRSVTLDLRRPEGRRVLLQLLQGADVLVANFTPGTLERWGLGYHEVAAVNPRLVYALGSTFGTEGAGAGRGGADLSGQAAGGLAAGTGPAGHPTPVGTTIADHVAAQNLLAGILAALVARQRTGRGQQVTTSLLGGQIWAQAAEYTAALAAGRQLPPADRGHALIPGIYGIFPTADGWIALVGVAGSMRRRLYAELGRPDLEERFPQRIYWDAEKARLFPILDEVFAAATTAEWCRRLDAADVRCAPVRDRAQVVADPDVWANGYLTEVDGPEGPTAVVAVPVAFSATPARPHPRAPQLGEHTDEVLVEAGYRAEEIEHLRQVGVL